MKSGTPSPLRGQAGGLLFLMVALSSPLPGQGNLDFSLDPLSPKVPAPFVDGDVIQPGGTDVRIPAADLGASGSGVIGLSYGRAEAADVDSPYYYKRIAYSVDRNATGNGAPIATEVAIDGAAGDTFALDFVGIGPRRFILRRPYNLAKAQIRDLTVKSDPADPEDDIDALSLYRDSDLPAYLTFPQGSGFDPATIHIVQTPGGTPAPFASAAQLGLAAGDVIDAFALGTIPFGGPPPTTLDPNVVIWISLAAGSPTRGGADSILQAWPAPIQTVLTSNHLNLGPGDEVNALAVLDPSKESGFDTSAESRTGDGNDFTINSTTDPTPREASIASVFNDLIVDPTGVSTRVSVQPKVGDAYDFSLSANGSGNVQSDPVGLLGCRLMVPVKVDAASGWQAAPGGDLRLEQGSILGFYELGNTAPMMTGAVQTCPAPGVFYAETQIVDKGADDPHAFVAGTSPASADPFTLGGILLNETAGAQQAFCLTAPHQGDNLGSPMGLMLGAASNVVVTAADLRISGDVCRAIAAVVTTEQDMTASAVSSDGVGLPMAMSGVAPMGTGATVLVDFSIIGSEVTINQTIPIETGAGSTTIPEVRKVRFAGDRILVALNVSGAFHLLGGTYGEANNPNSHFIAINATGEPGVTGHYETNSMPAIRTEISDFAFNPLGGTVGITGNTIVGETTVPFDYDLTNTDTGDAFGIYFPGAIGISAWAACIHAETFGIGDMIISTRPADPSDDYPYNFFTGINPWAEGFQISGVSFTPDLYADPYQLPIPVVVTSVPGEERQFFSLNIVPTVNDGEISFTFERGPSGVPHFQWSGQGIECSNDLTFWQKMHGLPRSFHGSITDDPDKFFRAYGD